MGKVLNKVLQAAVNEILQVLPTLGESGSEVSYFIRGPHQNFSDFIYSGSTDENQLIVFYFKFYALEQSSWMLLKLFLFSENYFWLKYLCFLDTPICVFFSNLGQSLEINYVFFYITFWLYCTL